MKNLLSLILILHITIGFSQGNGPSNLDQNDILWICKLSDTVELIKKIECLENEIKILDSILNKEVRDFQKELKNDSLRLEIRVEQRKWQKEKLEHLMAKIKNIENNEPKLILQKDISEEYKRRILIIRLRKLTLNHGPK